jgi:hypothetical protein
VAAQHRAHMIAVAISAQPRQRVEERQIRFAATDLLDTLSVADQHAFPSLQLVDEATHEGRLAGAGLAGDERHIQVPDDASAHQSRIVASSRSRPTKAWTPSTEGGVRLTGATIR